MASLRETLKHASSDTRLKELEEENRRLTSELVYLKGQLEGGSGSDDGHPPNWAVRALINFYVEI